MPAVQAEEYNDRRKDEIIGDLADLVDVGSILRSAACSSMEKCIDQALAMAKDSAKLQKDLIHYASSYDPDEVKDGLSLSSDHTKAFVEGCANQLGIEITERTHHGDVWHLRLPEAVLSDIGLTRSRWALCFDRAVAARRQEFLYASLDNWLMAYLLDFACHHEGRGVLAIVSGLGDQALLASVVRWQTPAGDRARQELALLETSGSRATLNPAWASHWLLEPQAPLEAGVAWSATPKPDVSLAAFEGAEERTHVLLRQRINSRMMPDQPQWVVAAWRQP